MKKIAPACIALITCAHSFAWPQQYTMEEATLGLRGKLAPQNLQQLNWLPGQDAFTYTAGANNEYLIRTQVPKMLTDTLLRVDDLNTQSKNSLKKIPTLNWINDSSVAFGQNNDWYLGSLAHGKWQVKQWAHLPENAENVSLHKGGKYLAYTVDNNLWLCDKRGNLTAISHETNKDIVYGQSVHRNEFGIDGGIFFSPKGNMVAFYRMDQTMVANYPVIDWATVPAQNHDIKYPMAGGTSHQVTIGVYNPAPGTTVYLKTGLPADQYLTSATWSPDEKYIFVAVLNRQQNHLWLNKYDAASGNFIKTLFEETDPKYVEPQHPLTFLPGSNTEFVWWSQRDGFMHLYRYDTEGKLLNQITKGNWIVTAIAGVRASAKCLVIVSTKESPLERHVYTVNWVNGRMNKLDKEPGTHIADVSTKGNYWIDRYQNAATPRVASVKSVNGSWTRELLQAADPLAAFQRPKIENITLKADDGTPLYGKLIYPTDFDATRKYPVIVYLYNGPHVQLVNNTYPASGNLWYEYMAQHGYVVFSMDGRGSGNRGLAFEQATFGRLGTKEMDDQLQGVAYLKSLPFVDSNRMGVHGWSFGGFMTTSLMLRHPGVFTCAVAGGPVIDWGMYEIMYTERYMDTPQENPQGYADNNLLTKTKNLKGKLLMIHGAQDDVVVWQHSLKFVKACVDNGVQLDYFVYPGHQHNVQGKDRVHLMQKITDYFDEYLK
ncbi:MAG: DPP IV N-terminal domain-containing protein [Edaphocola sp.]